MDDSALTVEQLDALSRAVPEEQELKDLALYLEVRFESGDGLQAAYSRAPVCTCRPAPLRCGLYMSHSQRRSCHLLMWPPATVGNSHKGTIW